MSARNFATHEQAHVNSPGMTRSRRPNQGQYLLRDVCQRVTAARVAQRVMVSERMVDSWTNGETLPDYAARRALLAEYGIAIDAWSTAGAPREQP